MQPPWAAATATRLEQMAAPILSRKQPLTASHATTIRLTALCLATEADILDQHDASHAFREIAAGITLLERRITGTDPAPDIIILATE
jgi:hypothetical protein